MPFDRAKFPQQYLHRHQHYQLIIWITPETQKTMLFMSLVNTYYFYFDGLNK